MAKATAKKTRAPKPEAAALPADLDALQNAVEQDDLLVIEATDRARASRRAMVDEIAMLRAQVERLSRTCGNLVDGIREVEAGWHQGKPDVSSLFNLLAPAEGVRDTLDMERRTFYDRRDTGQQITRAFDKPKFAEDLARNLLADDTDPPPGFLLGDRQHPAEGRAFVPGTALPVEAGIAHRLKPDDFAVNGDPEEPRGNGIAAPIRNVAAALVVGIGLTLFGWFA